MVVMDEHRQAARRSSEREQSLQSEREHSASLRGAAGRAAEDRGEAAPGDGGGRGREPRQERVPRQRQPRGPHADERDHRADAAHAGDRPDARAAREPRHGEGLGRLAAPGHQRHPRLLEDRGRAPRARQRASSSSATWWPTRSRRSRCAPTRRGWSSATGSRPASPRACAATRFASARSCSTWWVTPSSSPTRERCSCRSTVDQQGARGSVRLRAALPGARHGDGHPEGQAADHLRGLRAGRRVDARASTRGPASASRSRRAWSSSCTAVCGSRARSGRGAPSTSRPPRHARRAKARGPPSLPSVGQGRAHPGRGRQPDERRHPRRAAARLGLRPRRRRQRRRGARGGAGAADGPGDPFDLVADRRRDARHGRLRAGPCPATARIAAARGHDADHRRAREPRARTIASCASPRYLTKPIRSGDLLAAIVRSLGAELRRREGEPDARSRAPRQVAAPSRCASCSPRTT